MESFEHVTKIWLEAEGYAVSSGVKFPVKILTRKKSRPEEQTHGYEIDLVGARANELVLVNVKSFFGSKGLDLAFLRKEKIFSNPNIFKGIVDGAGSRFGYSRRQIRLYVVAGRATDGRRREIESWLADFSKTNRLPVTFIGVERIAEGLLKASTSKMYIDDPVIATVKTLRAAGCLKEEAK